MFEKFLTGLAWVSVILFSMLVFVVICMVMFLVGSYAWQWVVWLNGSGSTSSLSMFSLATACWLLAHFGEWGEKRLSTKKQKVKRT